MSLQTFASDLPPGTDPLRARRLAQIRKIIALGFIATTVFGGFVDGVGTADAGPPSHAKAGGEGNDKCHPVHGCADDTTVDDTSEPEVAIDAPDQGASVSDVVTVEGTASDDSELVDVGVLLNGEELDGVDGLSSWSVPLDTSTVEDGTHQVTARAKDAAGNVASTSVDIVVDNTVEDDTTEEPTEESSTEESTEEPTEESTEDSAEESTGLWLSDEEIASLPTSGDAWEALYEDAVGEWGSADVSDQDSRHDTQVLAGALVGVRLDHDGMKDRVRKALATVPGTEEGGRTLALGRNLVAYVLAADLVDYRDSSFMTWVDDVRFTELDGRTLVSTHEVRPNNWGTHAGASRIAAALYLGDQGELDRAADVFAGWLGDRTRYAGFKYGDLSWQCDPDRPVGINPDGCTIDGHDVGGVLPDDQRRGGGFTWPPPAENYVWEALQGAVVQAELLDRAGFDAWSWSDRALVRAVDWLHTYPDYPAEGDDTWIPWLVNSAASTSFPAPSPSQHGKNLGYTDWSHT